MGGIVGETYELDDGEVMELSPQLTDVADIPDHEVAERRRALVHYVRKGADPDRVANVLGMGDWESDPALALMVKRAVDAFICQVEIDANEDMRKGGKLSAGYKFILETRAGYTKDKKDAGADNKADAGVVILRKVQKGTEETPTPADENRHAS